MPNPKYRLTFGKHKGKLLSEVPYAYLTWILREFDPKKSFDLRLLISRELDTPVRQNYARIRRPYWHPPNYGASESFSKEDFHEIQGSLGFIENEDGGWSYAKRMGGWSLVCEL